MDRLIANATPREAPGEPLSPAGSDLEGGDSRSAADPERVSPADSDPAVADDGSAGVASPESRALNRRAEALQTDGRFADAERCWQDLLATDPDDSEALCGVAYCLLALGRVDEALAYVRRVLAAPVIHFTARVRLGSKLVDLHRRDDAIAVFRSVTAGFPDQGDAWNHLGAAELGADRPAFALASLRRASLLQPTSAAVWCNLALALMALDRLPEALAASHRALAIEPASSVATFNKGAVLLAMGRLKEGFAAYEHRFALGGQGWLKPDVTAPPWIGEPLAGRSILVVGEQANGDQIQFVRYLPELCRQGARVTFVAPKRLHRLLRSLDGDTTLVEAPEGGSRFDFQVPLLSLPHRCASEDGRVPAATPYLRAEAERVARWRERIGHHGFRVAVAWEGFRYPGGRDLGRCYPVEALWPLSRIPGVRLLSLQLKEGLDQLGRLPPGMAVETFGEDFDAGEHAFLDSAAVMVNVDLVVTLDSGVAHLAGALARPTWRALRVAPEGRGQRGRVDSPWYPTMRLFRQRVLGDWDGVFQRMAEALAPVAEARATPRAAAAPPVPAPVLPLAPVSCGEVLDKISILEIKVERLPPEASAQAAFELRHLGAVLRGFGPLDDATEAHVAELHRVNRALWGVEDRLRRHEAENRFDAEFVALARSVYALNDERASLKRRINVGLNSAIVEQKSYDDRPRTGEA